MGNLPAIDSSAEKGSFEVIFPLVGMTRGRDWEHWVRVQTGKPCWLLLTSLRSPRFDTDTPIHAIAPTISGSNHKTNTFYSHHYA